MDCGTAESVTTVEFLRRHTIDTRPLRHIPFRRMFIGNAVANFGLQFTAVAVPVQMYSITRSSLWVGLLGLAALIPLLVFSLWGGAVSDRVDRRLLLLGASLVMWAATLCLLGQALLHVDSPVLLLVLVGVQATGFAGSSPTRNAIVPRLVGTAEIPAANTLNTTMFNAAMVAGPLMAGLLVRQNDFAAAYLVDALAFTVTLWATIRLPPIPPINAAVEGAPRIAGWAEVREGLLYIATEPVLWLSFAIDIAAMVLALPRSLFPQVAAERFGSSSVGWLYAAIAIGSVVAGLTSGWIGRVRRQGVALTMAVVVWGVAVALSGLAHSLFLCVLLLAVGGAADMVSGVYRQTILQTYAPDGFRGRLQGVFIAVVAGGPRLGDVRAGATAAVYGATVSWVGGGIAAVVVALGLVAVFPALIRYSPQPATS
jgi:MFS family permease